MALATEDAAEHRLLAVDVRADGDEGIDVPVLERAAVAALDREPVVRDRADGAGLDGIDGGPVRRRDVDAGVEGERAAAGEQRPLARRAVEEGAGVAEAAPDRMRLVERLDRPGVRCGSLPGGAGEGGSGKEAERRREGESGRCARADVGCGRHGRTVRRAPKSRPHGAAHGRLTALWRSTWKTRYNRLHAAFRVLGSARGRGATTARRSRSAARSSGRCSRCCCCARARSSRPTTSIDAIWGDDAPRTATTSLQNSIVGLRKPLGPTSCGPARRATSSTSTATTRPRRFERLVAPRRAGQEPLERAPAAARGARSLARGAARRVRLRAVRRDEIRRLEELRLADDEELDRRRARARPRRGARAAARVARRASTGCASG